MVAIAHSRLLSSWRGRQAGANRVSSPPSSAQAQAVVRNLCCGQDCKLCCKLHGGQRSSSAPASQRLWPQSASGCGGGWPVPTCGLNWASMGTASLVSSIISICPDKGPSNGFSDGLSRQPQHTQVRGPARHLVGQGSSRPPATSSRPLSPHARHAHFNSMWIFLSAEGETHARVPGAHTCGARRRCA